MYNAEHYYANAYCLHNFFEFSQKKIYEIPMKTLESQHTFPHLLRKTYIPNY